MKRFSKILIVALLAIVMTMVLIACDEEDTNKGVFTHKIESTEDLIKVSEMLGADYDKGVFELENDLTIESYQPLGDSVDNSFRGEFKGNGHTITYNINIPEPEERDTNNPLPEDAFYGLFGVIHNAKISNLTLNVNITVPANASSFYVGGLAGFMSGNNTITNVDVNGNVHTTMGNICKFIDVETNWRESERYEMTGFVGGLAGFIQGNTSINAIDSSVAINVDANKSGSCVSGVDDLFVGGVVGSMRTVNLSSLRANSDYCSATNLRYSGVINAIGSQVNVGGIFGSASRINDGEKWFTDSSSISAEAYKRLRIGGIAGILDRVNLDKTKVELDEINAEVFSKTVSRSFNVGGLVGYLANFSTINNAISDVDTITVSTDVINYTGGLVGTSHFSKINNSVASGELFYDRQSITTITYINYEGNTQNNPYYIYNGGMIGRVYGESQMNNVSSNFKAYQGLVGEAANAIEIVVIKDGETIEEWFASTVYDASMTTTPEKEGEKVDGEQKYKITHLYKLENIVDGNTNLSFVAINSRCYNDKGTNAKAEEWYKPIGVEQNDTTTYNSLYNTINSNINA